MRAWKRLHGLREAGAFGGWLRRLAVNLFIDARRIARETDEIAEDAPSEDVAPERMAGARIDLARALALLSPAERLCVTLNLGEGLSHGEIAETAGLPLGTVKSHVARGAAKLRKALGDKDG